MNKKVYIIILLIIITGCNVLLHDITASLGEPFTLRKGQSANIQDEDNSIKIILRDFINSPCPKGAYCIWSGQAVLFDFWLNGKKYDSYTYNTPYNVGGAGTDFKTYANFIVTSAESDCMHKSNEYYNRDECWRELSRRINDTKFCNRITTQITKDACFEDMVKILEDKSLCRNVLTPVNYCLS